MNFLLLHRDEIGSDGIARLRGRRAEHVRTVLRAEPGQTLRAGVVDGSVGTATVLEVTDDEIAVAATCTEDPPPAADVLLLAVPRPKVLQRMLAYAAALGARRIVLFRSWKVEKSHLQSTPMRPEVQREQLLLGLEQAGRTLLPQVTFFPLFKPMVEDHLGELSLPHQRFVGHPGATTTTDQLALSPKAPFALLLGPDGGLIPYEIEALQRAGFLAVACGDRRPQRTEMALGVLWGQLDLLRRIARHGDGHPAP